LKSSRADEAGRDWLPYAGRALGEGRAAVFRQQSLDCVFASSSEEKSPEKAEGFLSAENNTGCSACHVNITYHDAMGKIWLFISVGCSSSRWECAEQTGLNKVGEPLPFAECLKSLLQCAAYRLCCSGKPRQQHSSSKCILSGCKRWIL